MTTEATQTPLVRMSGVNKHFGSFQALSDINVDIPKGQVCIVVGPSGSGKSTLCRTINRLETIDDDGGYIEIDGNRLPEEGKALAALRADVGMVFQSFNLFAHKSVLENVTLGPIKVRKVTKKQAEQQAMEYLERVGVGEQARKLPAQLSGGQQQRVAIARSLIANPAIIFADEPTGNLDTKTSAAIIDLLFQRLEETGATLLLITHDQALAGRCRHIFHMQDGRISQDISR